MTNLSNRTVTSNVHGIGTWSMQGSETGRTRRKSRNWTVTYGGYMVNGTVMKAHPSQEAAWTALRSPSNGGSERECLEPQSLYSILYSCTAVLVDRVRSEQTDSASTAQSARPRESASTPMASFTQLNFGAIAVTGHYEKDKHKKRRDT